MDLNSITAANQRDSPLLRLPAELRNKIYRYAFESNVICLKQINKKYEDCGSFTIRPMSLAQSCTQCRYEALPYFWQSTIFHLYYDNMHDLVRDTSQSMRDQIKVVRPCDYVDWDLQLGLHTRRGAFSGVQKIILVFREFLVDDRDEYTKRLRENFGADAELVYPYG